jgi:hypothetical protein
VNPFATIVLEKRLPTVFSYREFFPTSGLISYESAKHLRRCIQRRAYIFLAESLLRDQGKRVAFLTAPLDRKDSYQSIAPVARWAGYLWGR